MGTLSDGHCPLLVHSSKLLPLIMALEILYTWDGDSTLLLLLLQLQLRPGVASVLYRYGPRGSGTLQLVWPRFYTGMVPEALTTSTTPSWCNSWGPGEWRLGTGVALCITQHGPSSS